jgi:hypothetical protein
VSAILTQSKYADTPVICWHTRACATACKTTVSNTNGLYWEFHNIQYRRRGPSRQKDNDFFFGGSSFSNKKKKKTCISRTPILEGKFLSKVQLIHAQIRYFLYFVNACDFWFSGYGGGTDISLDCGRFYGPFVCPQMRMSEGVNE